MVGKILLENQLLLDWKFSS